MKSSASPNLLFLLVLIATVISTPATAQPPEYDATGTWDYQYTDGWTDCPGDSAFDQTGTLVISQSEAAFSIKFDEGFEQNGSITGSRYQVYSGAPRFDGGGIGQTTIWDLESSVIGRGYLTQVRTSIEQICGFNYTFHMQKQAVCQPSDTRMCLQDGRFSVTVTWRDETGKTGVGHAIPSTDDSGLFWFFSRANLELLIKVLNGCGINNRYWVFFAATTDQEFTISVTDTQAGQLAIYTNPLKTPADAVTDTSAFAVCP